MLVLMNGLHGIRKYATGGARLHQIKGVEIFSVGVWKGRRYTAAMLDEMIANFGKVGFGIPVKLGHVMNDSAPAVGWIKTLYRQGDVLLADIGDIAPDIFKQVESRAFDHVSAEIAFNLERNGKKFGNVLTAIALLGGAMPAVDLKPIREATFLTALTAAELSGVELHSYTQGENTMPANRITDLEASIATLSANIDGEKDAAKKVAFMTERDTLRTQLDTARTENHAAEVARLAAEGGGGDAAKMAELTKHNAIMAKQLAKLSANEKASRVAALASGVTLPKFKPYFSALAALAVEDDERTVSFTAAGADAKPENITVIALLEGLKTEANAYAASLLRGVSVPGNAGQHAEWEGSPETEVQKRADKLIKDAGGAGKLDIGDAFEQVLNADDALRMAYNQS